MAEPGTPAKQGNVFTRKIGPLPMWAWTGIILTPVVIYGVIARKKAATTASTAATTTDASQVPQFVNQTYVSPTPPSTNGTMPAGGPTAAQFAALSEQVTDVGQQGETQAAVNRSQGEAIQDLNAAGKKKPPPKKKAPPRPGPGGSGAGKRNPGPPRRRGAPVRAR
jgi:hypothetical protein